MNHTPSDPDDIDRLLRRLERRPVPDGFTARVLASTVSRPRPWPWIVAGLVSLALLVMTGYQLGGSLASTDGLELIEAVVGDSSLLSSAPGDVAAAFGEVIPWRLVVLAGISAACVVWVAGRLVSLVSAPRRVA